MANTDTWKTAERTIARMVGAQRVGVTGTSTPDAVSSHLCVEVKHRRKRALPVWIGEALARVRRQAGDGKLGLVVVHLDGQRYGDSLVCMTLQDFADWYVSPLAGATDEDLAVLAPDVLAEETAQT